MDGPQAGTPNIRRPLTLLLASFVLGFLRPRPLIHPNALAVRSIDVGEGDATLLVTLQGRTLQIDAGEPIGPGGSQLDFGEDVISPYLWPHGISRLDVVAITHGHSDHIEGMIAVLKNFRPQELWVGLEPPSFALRNVITTAHELAVNVVHLWEGDEFELGGVRGEVLFPPADCPLGARPQNNDSLVLQPTYGKSSVLLEGDAEKAGRTPDRRIASPHRNSAESGASRQCERDYRCARGFGKACLCSHFCGVRKFIRIPAND